MFKMWKHIEKRYQKRKAQEEEEKRKKDDEDDKGKKDGGNKGKKNDGDRWKKGDGDNGKKDDGDEDKKRKDRKREEKDDDEITGEELEEQLQMEADREWRRLEMQSVPEDTLDYVEDQDVEEDDDKDNHDQERDDDDDTSATSEEKVGGDDRPGEGDARKKEGKIPFNFEAKMEMLCKRLSFTHGHYVEERLRTDRIIKAYHKKKEWNNLRARMEDEERKAMAEKFDEDLRLRFQERGREAEIEGGPGIR